MTWITISVDEEVNAFPQAILAKLLFLQTPREFLNKYRTNRCLKLTQSLNGSKFTPKNWYTCCHKALLKLGLQECPFNKCLFYCPGILMVLYVNDTRIAGPTRKNVKNFVEEL